MKKIGYYLVMFLERICVLTHWLNPLFCRVFNRHCLPTLLAFKLDEKYKLGFWEYEK